MAQFTHDGVIYEELPDGNVRVVGHASQGGAQTIQLTPASPLIQRGKEGEVRGRDLSNQETAATLPYAAPRAAADIQNTQIGTQGRSLENQRTAMELQRGAVSDNTRVNALGAFNAANELYRVADELEKQYKDGNLSKTSGWSGVMDFIPSGENRRFESTGNQARGYLKSALGFTSGEGNTMAESDATYGPYTPTSWDSNETVLNKIAAMRALADKARVQTVQTLGGIPDAAGNVMPLPLDEQGRPYLPQASLASRGVTNETALTGKSEGGRVRDPAMAGFAAQVRQAVANGATADQLIAMEAVKMAELGRPLSQDRIQFYRELEKSISENPNVPLNSLAVNWDALEDTTEQAQDVGFLQGVQEGVAASPFGTGAINAANAAAFGLPAAMSDNFGAITEQAREENPLSAFIGDAAGSTAAVLGGIAAAPRMLGRFAGLPADTLYSAVRGGAEGGPVGAILGAGMGVAGNRLGAGFGGGANNVTSRFTQGGERPDNYMRMIARDLEPEAPDRIAEALANARAIAPANVLDVTPELLPLGSAAFRRSTPETRAGLSEFMIERSIDQGRRLDDAIVRELGPIQNPDAAIDSFKLAARADSSPQYDAFRAEPPRSSPELESVLSTAFGRRALGEVAKVAEAKQLPFDPANLSPNDQDLVMRALRDATSLDSTPFSGVTPVLNQAQGDLAKRWVREMDTLYPDTYPHARQLYRDNMQSADAVTQGRGFLRESRHTLPDAIPDEAHFTRPAYELGARSALSDIANDTADAANPWKNALGSSTKREKFGSVFGPSRAAAMQTAYDLERDMLRTQGSTIGNSATAQRIIDDGMLNDEYSRILGNVITDVANNPSATGVIGAGINLGTNAIKDRLATGAFRNLEGVSTQMTNDLMSDTIDPLLFRDQLAAAIEYNLRKQQAQRYAGAGTTGILSGGVNTYGGIN